MSKFLVKIDKNIKYYRQRTLIQARKLRWSLSPKSADRPIFVVSGSRSGTQMLYKTLSESQELGSLNREIYAVWDTLHKPADKNWESHVLTASDASDYDRAYITRYFYTHTGKIRFLDKNNQHGLAVSYLYALFPDARFIYIKRNPGDTLNSMIEAWGKPERFATWSTELPAKVNIDGGRYSHWCHFLPPGWRAYLNAPIEEVCAFQYETIHASILEAKNTIPQTQWTEMFYEDIIVDPVEQLRFLFRNLELSFTKQIEARVANLLDRPYDALFEIRLAKWKEHRYRARIERALPRLQNIAEKLGYNT